MNKETKQLNIFLAAVAVIGITVPFMSANAERQIQAAQMQVDQMEVTRDVYRALYTVSLSCDIEDALLAAFDGDNKISFIEAAHIGDVCAADALKKANNPFERGMLKQELQYIKNGGVSM